MEHFKGWKYERQERLQRRKLNTKRGVLKKKVQHLFYTADGTRLRGYKAVERYLEKQRISIANVKELLKNIPEGEIFPKYKPLQQDIETFFNPNAKNENPPEMSEIVAEHKEIQKECPIASQMISLAMSLKGVHAKRYDLSLISKYILNAYKAPDTLEEALIQAYTKYKGLCFTETENITEMRECIKGMLKHIHGVSYTPTRRNVAATLQEEVRNISKEIAENINVDAEKLEKLIKDPKRIIPFGRQQFGELIDDVFEKDPTFIRWLANYTGQRNGITPCVPRNALSNCPRYRKYARELLKHTCIYCLEPLDRPQLQMNFSLMDEKGMQPSFDQSRTFQSLLPDWKWCSGCFMLSQEGWRCSKRKRR